jgi:hypothetical protein
MILSVAVSKITEDSQKILEDSAVHQHHLNHVTETAHVFQLFCNKELVHTTADEKTHQPTSTMVYII